MIEMSPSLWLPPKPAIIREWKREDLRKPRATFPFPTFLPSAVKPSLTFTHSAVDATNQTTYSFASCAIGTAAANRHVIVGVAGRNASVARTYSSATINGVSATDYAAGTISNSLAAILIAAVPTGTSVTIDITFSGVLERAAIAVWAAYGLSSAVAVDSLNTASSTLDINTSADGVICAIKFGVSQTPTWSGLTQDVADTVVEGLNEYTAASASLTPAATPRAISVGTVGTVPVAAIASFR